MLTNVPKHSWLLTACNTVIRIILVVILGYLFLLSIFGTCMLNFETGSEATAYLKDYPTLHVAVIIMLFLFGYLISRHAAVRDRIRSIMQNRRFLLAVHIAVAAVMLSAILICRYQPVSDQFNCLYSADHLLNGNYSSWEKNGYLYIYPELNGLTLLFTPFVAVFGVLNASIAIQIVNLLLLLLASYSLYRFCGCVRLNGAAASICFILYLPITFYIFFVYGNMASLSLSVFAIWKAAEYLREERAKDLLCSAAAISLAVIFKETAKIALLAVLIVLALHAVLNKKPKYLLAVSIYVLFLICSNALTDTLSETITGEEVSPGLSPYGKLTMGILEGERANGWYNSYTIYLLGDCEGDLDKYAASSKEIFLLYSKPFYSDLSKCIPFLAKKTASQWNNPTFQSLWIQQQMLIREERYGDFPSRAPEFICLDGSPSNMVFYYVFNILQSIILFGSLCFFIFDAGKTSLASLVPAITFIGGFLFLLFWEAKSQYTLLYFVLLIPYAVHGLCSIIKKVSSPAGTKQWYRSKEAIFLGCLLCAILFLSVADTAYINSTVKMASVEDERDYAHYLEENTDANPVGILP